MRRVAATVTIVTVASDDGPVGMTATAVSAVAADPPSLLVCVNRSAAMHASLERAERFCVNVLHREQEELARTFSDQRLRHLRFGSGNWNFSDDGPPVLIEAQASLVCERQQLIAFATHSICIGVVRAVRARDEVDPLLYLNGAYSRSACP